MNKVHEIDGVAIYETEAGEDLVIHPMEIGTLKSQTLKKIQTWCTANHEAYKAKNRFVMLCHCTWIEQGITLDDLNLIISTFSGTEIGELARKAKKAAITPWWQLERTPTPPTMRRKQRGSIYVLKAENGLYKIGKSATPTKRILNLRTQSPVDVTLVGHIEVEDYHEIERTLHARFSSKRRRGEWFELAEEDVTTILTPTQYAEVAA